MFTNKTWLAVGLASLLGGMALSAQAADLNIAQLAAHAPERVAAPAPAQPLPPAAEQGRPQGFDNSAPQVADAYGPRPGAGYGRGYDGERGYYYRDGYCPRGFDRPHHRGDRFYCPRGYHRGMQDMMTDERYSAEVDEIENIEDLLFIERKVLRALQNNPDVTTAQLRAQAKTVVDLKNRLDAKYDALMQKYIDDNGDDALPGYYDGRRPHHFMRHHRNWHHY